MQFQQSTFSLILPVCYFYYMKILTALFFVFAYSIVFARPEKVLELKHNDSQVLFSSNDSVACYRIPALITAANGHLIAAVDQRVPSCGDLKWNGNINIVIRRSSDSGKTWSEIETVLDYPVGQSASDPSLLLDKVTGEIFMFFNFMDLMREKDVYYLRYIKSADHGKTWSEAVDITAQISKPDWHHDFKFITSGRGIQTSEGKLLNTLVNLQKGLYLFGSDDHGLSWHLIDYPLFPGDESKVAELSDGRWMVNSRVNGLGYRYIHISSDKGKSWQSFPDSSLCDPGCNASFLSFSNVLKGKKTPVLIFSNPDNATERKNLSIKYSLNDGLTWSEGQNIYSGNAAYSSMTILRNGDLGILYERDDYQEVVFSRFEFIE